MRAVLVAISSLAIACLPYWEEPATKTTEPTVAPPLADRLAELADAIDAGPQPQLHASLTPWIADALEVPAKLPRGDELHAALEQPLDAWAKLGPDASERERVAAIAALARATVIAEKQLGGTKVDVDVLFALERLYHAFDQPHLDRDGDTLARHVAAFAQLAAARGRLDDQRLLPELVRVVRGAILGSGALHRHTVARILRQAPGNPQVADVLARVAVGIGHRNDELAVAAMQLSVELRPVGAVLPPHQLELAATCFEALDLACGNEALRAAEPVRREGNAALRDRFARIEELGRLANEAVRLDDRADADARLRRAEIMLVLHRFDDAEELYRTLHRQHPDDARAVAGLARHAIASKADFHAAYQFIERSEAPEHRDRTYYEIAIGTRATTLVQDVLPRAAEGGLDEAVALAGPYLAKLRADVIAYEALGADDGVVLHFVLDRLDEAVELMRRGKQDEMRTRGRALLPAAKELQAKVPKNVHAYRILLSAASLSSDAKAAFEVVDAPVPDLGEHRSEAALRRAFALLDLAIAWEKFDRLDDVLRMLDEAKLSNDDARALAVRAHVAAMQARVNGDAEAWVRAADLYRAAAADPEAPAVVLHDLGVVLHELDKREEALMWWDRALARVSDEQRDVIRLHEALGAADPSFVTVQPFTTADDEELALVALRWATKLAPPRDAPAIRKALRKAEAAVRKASLRPTLPPGRAGVLLAGSVRFDLSYAGEGGLQFVFDIAMSPWLVLVPQ